VFDNEINACSAVTAFETQADADTIRGVVAVILCVLLSLVASPQIASAASDNECAACHLRLVWTRSETTHVDEWVTSKHAFYRVGCEQCHGGDRRALDASVAHRGVLDSGERRSKVYREALPATCGRCHTSEAKAFATTAHQTLLSQHDDRAPTCTSCHSSMASDVPSPAAVEQQCRQCHSDVQQDRAHDVRHQLEELAALRTVLRRAAIEIAAVTIADRRTVLRALLSDGRGALRAVVAGLHAFDKGRVDAGLRDAHDRVDALTTQLGQ